MVVTLSDLGLNSQRLYLFGLSRNERKDMDSRTRTVQSRRLNTGFSSELPVDRYKPELVWKAQRMKRSDNDNAEDNSLQLN